MKRRTAGSILPTTSPDAKASRGGGIDGHNRSRRRRGRNSAFFGPLSICFTVAAVLFLVFYVTMDSLRGIFHHGGSTGGHAARNHADKRKQRDMTAERWKRDYRDREAPGDKGFDGIPGRGAADRRDKRHAPINERAAYGVLNKGRRGPGWDSILKSIRDVKRTAPTSALDQFPTLVESLKNAHLVAVYFAAAWSSESKPSTEALMNAFDTANVLFKPGEENNKSAAPLSIVYVSSDDTEEEFSSSGSTQWQRVPFNTGERTKLKQYFHACAQKEAEPLGVDRRFGIPHLVVLDSETRNIVTTTGVHDVQEHGVEALERWKELQAVVIGLDSKFDHEVGAVVE